MNDEQDEQGGEVLLGLGANEGDPVAQLSTAVQALSHVVRIGAVSSVYRSEPVGFAAQPDFYNVVVRGWTALGPLALLRAAQGVEEALGRRRTFRDAPRPIDVDILAYGGRVMRTDDLMLPHPRLHLRGFVLHPLVEVAPEWPHPVLLKTARELLSMAAALERVERVGALPGFGAPLAPAPPSG
jgi:2-amino-4-hydroxy-6-hydroxymethyldihydropteridine diphosphokinase